MQQRTPEETKVMLEAIARETRRLVDTWGGVDYDWAIGVVARANNHRYNRTEVRFGISEAVKNGYLDIKTLPGDLSKSIHPGV